MLNDLIRSKAFWAAIVLFTGALANWLLPNVPKEVVSAFLALLGAVAAVFAGQKVQEFKAARAAKL